MAIGQFGAVLVASTNEGLMNYFHRWAGTPSFRRWWPVLAPVYSAGFRAFVLEHFAIQIAKRFPLAAQSPGAPLDYV